MFNPVQPQTENEFKRYYHFRWRMLRAPWNQPEGSEQDTLESTCFHLMVQNTQQEVIACGRLQFNSDVEAQVRYMAVDPAYEGKGIGRTMMKALEQHALQHGSQRMILEAREQAVGFYLALGYQLEEKTHLLFGDIQHYRMSKRLIDSST